MKIFSNYEQKPQIASVAAMKLQSFDTGAILETVSYYGTWLITSDGAKGGTTYVVVTPAQYTSITGVATPDEYGDHTLANGNIAMIRDRSSKNVLTFGALGNDSANDTPFIQAAYDIVDQEGGGEVFFPTGIYVVNPIEANYLWLTSFSQRMNYAVFLIGSNTTTRGTGPGSVMKLGSTLPSGGLPNDGRGDFSTTHMIVNKSAPGLTRISDDTNIKVFDMCFDGNWVRESGDGISLVAVTNFQVMNCTFRNTYYECSYILFCRGGDWSHNFLNRGGRPDGFLQDGGGPLLDSSMCITLKDNILTDSGYYAILAVGCWQCEITNNVVKKLEYVYSSGYQGIRLGDCQDCKIDKNVVIDSGYAGIWDHIGNNNRITNNTVIKCGYDSEGGAQIHGITVDQTANKRVGRTMLYGNMSMLNFGSGISVLGAFTSGDETIYNSGCHITNNMCLYNRKDGVSVYGDYHQITGNICESNGGEITSGILGDGFSGISLNGSSYCVITNNTCSDIIQGAILPANLDANLFPLNTVEPIYVDHQSQTQNWGLRELPADYNDTVITATAVGTLVTVTEVGHNRTVGELISIYNAQQFEYNGYNIVSAVTGVDTWQYVASRGAPSSSPAIGQPDINSGIPGDVFVGESIRLSDYNIVTNNNFMNNIANPGLGRGNVTLGGVGKYVNPGFPQLNCGLNSTMNSNIGQ